MFMFGMLNDVVLFQYLSLSRVQPNIPLHTSPTKHTAFSAHGAIDEKHTYTLTLSHPFSYYIITRIHTHKHHRVFRMYSNIIFVVIVVN